MTFEEWFSKDKKEKLELGLGEILLQEDFLVIEAQKKEISYLKSLVKSLKKELAK